jgi:hypothetical protein
MIRKVLLGVFFTLVTLSSFAQISESGILPAATLKEKEFTEWKKVDFTIGSESLSYEYRICFLKRNSLACNYEVQVKNSSAKKLEIKIKSHYYDKLVKGNYGDEYKESIKPGKEQTFGIITQGCKADKEKKDQSDIERCTGCGMTYEIIADLD